MGYRRNWGCSNTTSIYQGAHHLPQGQSEDGCRPVIFYQCSMKLGWWAMQKREIGWRQGATTHFTVRLDYIPLSLFLHLTFPPCLSLSWSPLPLSLYLSSLQFSLLSYFVSWFHKSSFIFTLSARKSILRCFKINFCFLYPPSFNMNPILLISRISYWDLY